MIINEMAGSGGDLMPYVFKRRKIGPLVGNHTPGASDVLNPELVEWQLDDAAERKRSRLAEQLAGSLAVYSMIDCGPE